jgi:hypothetical protein
LPNSVDPPHANNTTHADKAKLPNFNDDRKPSAVKTPEPPTNKPDDTRVSWRGLTIDMSRLIPGNQPPLGTPVVHHKTTHLSDGQHGVPNAGQSRGTRTPNMRTSNGYNDYDITITPPTTAALMTLAQDALLNNSSTTITVPVVATLPRGIQDNRSRAT